MHFKENNCPVMRYELKEADRQFRYGWVHSSVGNSNQQPIHDRCHEDTISTLRVMGQQLSVIQLQKYLL